MSPADTATFRSLKVRNYRLFAGGQVVSLTGTWAQRLAQDWLVLSLTGGSGVALGIATGLQFLPVLLLSLYGGVLADRYDKRRLLIGAQAAMGVLALALGLLDVLGVVELWHVYLLALGLGLASAVDDPARQAFVTELVGPDDLANAVSLNSATFNSARIIGPALGGAMVAGVGTGWVFLINAASYLAVVAGLRAMRTAELQRAPRASRAKGQVREGLAYVRARPLLVAPLLLVLIVGTFGLNLQITLALLARQVFGTGAEGLAVLTASLAAGSLVGALASARRRGTPRMRRLFVAAALFGLLEIGVAFAPSLPVAALLLVPTGVAVITFTTTANSLVQLGSEPWVRGRVMALYVLVFLGGTPFGAPVVGAVADAAGPRTAIWGGGLVCALATLVVAVWFGRSRDVTVQTHLGDRGRPHVHVHS